MKKRHGLGAVTGAKTLLFAGYRVFDVVDAPWIAPIQQKPIFHWKNLTVFLITQKFNSAVALEG